MQKYNLKSGLRVVMAATPNPFVDAHDLVERVSARIGRTITVGPWDLGGPQDPAGMTLGTARADHILYADGEHGLRRNAIILHELGHIVLGHRLMLAEQVAAPARHNYGSGEERDAEEFATRYLAWLAARRPVDDGSEGGRMEEALR